MAAVSNVLDTIGEPNRRRLLELLRDVDEATVSELVEASGLRQPQVSKHLRTLAEADLVSARVDGRYRHYRLDGAGLRAAHDWFVSFEDVWRDRFDTLDQLVSADHVTAQSTDRLTGHPIDQPSDRRSDRSPTPAPQEERP